MQFLFLTVIVVFKTIFCSYRNSIIIIAVKIESVALLQVAIRDLFYDSLFILWHYFVNELIGSL